MAIALVFKQWRATMSEQLKNWLEPARSSLKRAINTEKNPKVKQLREQELTELEKYINNLS